MFSSLTGGKKGPRRLLPGSDEADADKSSGASAGASQKSGSEAAAGSSSRLTNPFAAASSKETRSASDSGVRTSSPLRGALSSSLGRFDPRALWGGASGSSKDGAPKGTDQQGPSAAGSSSSATAAGSKSGAGAASAGSGSAAAYASRRFLSSSDDVGTTRSASEQPSAATGATGATALSSATAATPFSSATAAAPPPALGLLGQGSSSYTQRPGAGSLAERSSSRQEQLTTLPSEEIDEVWATLDSEKGKGKGGSSLNPSPEPGMRWRRDSEASAASSRSATPPRSLLSRSAEGALPRSSSRGLTGVTGTAPESAAAAGGTGDSTSSSPRNSSLKDRAKLVREYVKLRSTPTPTPKGSTAGDSSYLRERLSAASDSGAAGSHSGGLGAPLPLAAAAGAGAGAAAAGTSTSLWRSRTPSPDVGATLQPSPLLGGGLQPSPLMGGGSGLTPSPLMGAGGMSSPARSVRFSDSSMPPSPVMPGSPTHAGRVSDASGGDLGAGSVSSFQGGSGVRLSSLVAAESRLRRKPQSAGGSAQSSPRAPVGIAETEFRRRGSIPTDRDEIEAENGSLGAQSGLRTLSSSRDRVSSFRDTATVSAPGAIPPGNPFASSSIAGIAGSEGTAAGAAAGSSMGGGAAAASRTAAAAGRPGPGASTAGAATAGAAAGAAVSGKPGFLGSLFGIRRRQQPDVEAPPSPKREPAAAAAPLGASPAKSLKSKQQQQRQQQDTAPVYDFYGADSHNDRDVYTAAAYGGDRAGYDRGYDYSSSYQAPPPRAEPYKQPVFSSKPTKEHHVNYKRMFYALLLMLAMAGVAVGIWAGVTYGRKNGEAPAPPLKPTNFTMSLAAGSRNSNGTTETCTDWFSNSTGIEKFRQTVADAYSKALNLPPTAIKVGDVGCKPAAPKGRLLLAGEEPVNRITTSISINVPIEGVDPGGGVSQGLLDQIASKVAAFFRSGGGGVSSSSSRKSSSSSAAAAAAANRTSSRMLLQDAPGSNSISSGITVDLPAGSPEVSEEIIKRIEQNSSEILSGPLSDLLGVPVAVEQVQHVGQQQLPPVPSPPPPSPPLPPPPPPSPPPPPPPRPPPPPPPPVRPWRPPVGVLPPTPANIIVIPDPSPRPRRRRKRVSPSPLPLPAEPITDQDVGDLGPSPEPEPSPSPEPLPSPEVVPSPSPRPRRRVRRSPRPSPLPSPTMPAVVPLPVLPRPSPSPELLPSPSPLPVPPPAPPPPPPSPVVPEPTVTPPPPEELPPSPSPRPRRRRRRSPSPQLDPNAALLPYPSPSPVVPPPAPIPTPLTEPQPAPQNPGLITNRPVGVLPSPDGVLQLPSPSPLVPEQVPTVPQVPLEAVQSPVPAFPPVSPNEPYATAPTCTRPPTSLNSVADTTGRLWGWEKGVSCVFRAATVSTAQPVSYSATTWQAAPTCWGVPTPQTSVLDDLGRLWGWQNGASCAYRNVPPLRGVAPAPVVEWESAPTCMFAPTRQNSVPDTKGRLWGWQNSQSCAFRG